MAPPPLMHSRRDGAEEIEVPLAGMAMSVVVALVSTTVISAFLTGRFRAIRKWRRLPFVLWVVFAIYVDSYAFVFVSAILQLAFGVNTNIGICDGAILLCLVCYVTTKLIYLFLVEKAHIVRCTPKRRLESKLYIFNSFGMLTIFGIVGILNFVFRITRMQNGECVIGMRNISMIPLISFDALVNVYLTSLFLVPLKKLYSLKNMPRTAANVRLRNVALRTFIGALCTLTSSIVNLTILMVLGGEPGWVCLMCCNCDILFSAIVIHWVTSKDNVASGSALNTPTGPEFPRRAAPSIMPSVSFTDPGIPLVTTVRSSRQDRVSDGVSAMASPPKPEVPPAVALVTTNAFHRESIVASSASISADSKRDDSSSVEYEFPPSRTTTTTTRSEEDV